MEKLNELVELANKASVAGQGSPEMIDFRVVANPDAIIAIAEAFRALEKGQCGSALFEREEHHVSVVSELIKRNADLERRAEAAEGWVKTAERTMDYQAGVITELGIRAEAAEAKLAEIPLFTRPAPAINLAELVPDERFCYHESDYDDGHAYGWNACRAEILRSIEEASKK